MISEAERAQILAMVGMNGSGLFMPQGAIAETIPRKLVASATALTLTSGTMVMTAMFLAAGQSIKNISFLSGSTAAATSTHVVFALYDNGLNLLGQTTDDTAASPWAANTVKTLSLPTAFVTTYSGLYYLAFWVTATTTPTVASYTSTTGATTPAPILAATSTASLLGAAPNPAGAQSAIANLAYGYVS